MEGGPESRPLWSKAVALFFLDRYFFHLTPWLPVLTYSAHWQAASTSLVFELTDVKVQNEASRSSSEPFKEFTLVCETSLFSMDWQSIQSCNYIASHTTGSAGSSKHSASRVIPPRHVSNRRDSHAVHIKEHVKGRSYREA